MAFDIISGNFSVIILIVADLVVCALILIYLFRDRRRNGNPVDTDRLKSLIDSLSVLIKESDRASRNLLDAINDRHRRTAELLEEMDAKEGRLKEAIRKTDELLPKAEDPGLTDKYAEVTRLADQGMKAEKISKQVKLPKGEIELILGLKR